MSSRCPPGVSRCPADTSNRLCPRVAGKMQNYELIHSSKVKFIYPSEEEMGDLTFIVAERKTSAGSSSSSSCSFNILLYLLVFQVKPAVLQGQLGLHSYLSCGVQTSGGSGPVTHLFIYEFIFQLIYFICIYFCLCIYLLICLFPVYLFILCIYIF